MKTELTFFIGLRDINKNLELKNTSLIAFLADVACYQSELLHFGVSDIDNTRKSWILLNWKVRLYKRPKFGNQLRIITWSRKVERLYAYRDFEIYIGDEKIGIASSKWILVDIDKGSFIKIPEDICALYNSDNISVFDEDEKLDKLSECTTYLLSSEYPISKTMIDINNHVNNVYYLGIAKDALPEDLKSNEFNEFEANYKKEIKYGDEIKSFYGISEEGENTVVIKSKDEKIVHAVIKFKN